MPQDPSLWSAFALVPIGLLQDKRLTPTQLRLLIALLRHCEPDKPDKPVWPSTRTLAQEVGLSAARGSLDKVRKALHQLAALGYLEIVSVKRANYRISLRPLLAARTPEPETQTYSSYVSPTPADMQTARVETCSSHVSSEQTRNQPIKSTDPNPPALTCPVDENSEALVAQLTGAGVSLKTARLSLQTAAGLLSAEELDSLAQRFAGKYCRNARNPSALWWKLIEKCLEDKKQEIADRERQEQERLAKIKQTREADRLRIEQARKYEKLPAWSEASKALFSATLAKLKSGFPVSQAENP